MKRTFKTIILAGILLPSLTFAAGKDLEYLIRLMIKYFNYAIQLTIALAVVMFVWNVYKYFIYSADNAEKKKESGQYVLWSIIGFFVILSIWGLVNILVNTFRLDDGAPRGFFPSFRASSNGSSDSDNANNSQFYYYGSNTTTGGSYGSNTTTGGSYGSNTTNGGSSNTDSSGFFPNDRSPLQNELGPQ